MGRRQQGKIVRARVIEILKNECPAKPGLRMEKEFSVRRLSIEYVNNQSPRQNTHLVQQPGNPIPTDNERQGSRLISLNPKAKTVEQEFRKQESDKAVTQKICTSQYENAQYESVTTKKRFDDSLLQLASVADNFRDLRFAITTKDIQGISGSPAEQQPSGKWKCVRGSMEVPMRLGKEYRESIPVYEPMPMPPDCFKKLYADPFF